MMKSSNLWHGHDEDDYFQGTSRTITTKKVDTSPCDLTAQANDDGSPYFHKNWVNSTSSTKPVLCFGNDDDGVED